jgi:hypothetical protein
VFKALGVEYSKWIADSSTKLGMALINTRPWDTAVERVLELLENME